MDIIRKFNDFDLKRVMRIWYEGNLKPMILLIKITGKRTLDL